MTFRIVLCLVYRCSGDKVRLDLCNLCLLLSGYIGLPSLFNRVKVKGEVMSNK